MNEIFTKILYELEEKQDLVLVSIVSQEGSSPRGPGTQMLVGEKGRILGTVGGGAVELNCEKHAARLLQEKRSDEKQFSLTRGKKDDIGMVCGGDITAWFQFIDATLPFWSELSQKLLQLFSEHKDGWLALNRNGTLPALLDADGTAICGSLSERILSFVPGTYIKTESSCLLPLPVKDRAVVFGGGHCAQALVPLLSKVGFCVTVMDNRPELARTELFPDAEHVVCGDFSKVSDYIQLSVSDYVVIMTNGHSHDLEVQRQVLQNPPVYVGVIGSKNKKDFINQKLLEEGVSDAIIQKIHSPIGTAIKAVTPEEIAVSIAGEMIYERALLRESSGILVQGCPMHE